MVLPVQAWEAIYREHPGSALMNCARKVPELWRKNEITVSKYDSIKCFYVQFMIKNDIII